MVNKENLLVDGKKLGKKVTSFIMTCNDEQQCATIVYITNNDRQRMITVELEAISFGINS